MSLGSDGTANAIEKFVETRPKPPHGEFNHQGVNYGSFSGVKGKEDVGHR